MFTALLFGIAVLILTLIFMVILPIASILMVPLLLDVLFIVGIVKVLTRKKRKEKKS